MTLYTVRFTTKKGCKRFDTKGKLVSETWEDIPVCMTAMPHVTAMSYSGCYNFRIEAEVVDRSVRQTAPRHHFVEATRGRYDKASARTTTTVAKAPPVSAVSKAASTGNLAAAINGGS